MNNTKSGKAADKHGLIIEFFKMINTTAMMTTLAGNFNGLLTEGRFPTTWAEAIAVPLFKASKMNIPCNYRYIMLNIVFYKIYAKACNILLTPYLNVPGQSWQVGFRKSHSCLHYIFTLRCIVEHHKTRDKPVHACFVDFRKAFDMVPRAILCEQMRKVGVPLILTLLRPPIQILDVWMFW